MHLTLQSKEISLDVYVVYIYIKSGIFGFFGRIKQLAGAEATSKLQVSSLNLAIHLNIQHSDTSQLLL